MMSRTLRRALVSAGLAGTFVYGFAAGAYRLPPFHQVAWVKNAVVERLRTEPEGYTPAAATAPVIIETAVQRLLVKRIPVPAPEESFQGGGGLAVVGDRLYVLTTHGKVLAYDMAAIRPLGVAVPPAPINRDSLLRARMRYEINLSFFRLVGVHAEAASDSTHVLFAYHNRYDPARECITANLSRITVRVGRDSVTAVTPWATIFTASPCMRPFAGQKIPFPGHISGGHMFSYDADHLLLSVGDFAQDEGTAATFDPANHPTPYSQDRSHPMGKILRIHKQTGAWEIYALGVRNPMGLYRDAEGRIWATESGPQGGDELNLVEQGANYGWPLATFGIDYETRPWRYAERQGKHDAFVPPAMAWLPSVVPTGVIRIEGPDAAFAPWRGDLLLGTLRDQSLRRLALGRDGRVLVDERIYLGDRIRDLRRLSDGSIIALTDATGHLLVIADGGPVYERTDDRTLARIASLDRLDALTGGARPAAVMAGPAVFGARCASCHGLEGKTLVGPPLNGVVSRKVGGHPGYSYSSQLAYDGRQWTPALLRSFLLQPEREFLNTRMPKVGLSAPEADSVIAYLGGAATPR